MKRIKPVKVDQIIDEPRSTELQLVDFYAYMPSHRYIFAPTRELWPGSSVNARIPPIDVGTNDKGEPVTIPASAFFEVTAMPDVDVLCTNPPYARDHATAWVRHALSLRPARPMWFLLASDFLHGASRADLHAKLVRVWLFRSRLPRMHRVGWAGPKASSQADHAWYLFDARHDGSPPTIGWL